MKSIFTVVVKDNIDFNATSSTAVKHFHGVEHFYEFALAENLATITVCQNLPN